MSEEKRNAQQFNPDTGKWEPIAFGDIKKGMVFRLWEAKLPVLVLDQYGNSVWVALNNAYMDPSIPCCENCHKIETDPLANWIKGEGETWD